MQVRPYTPNDWEAVRDLLLTYRGAGFVQRYPTLWRLRLLLTSRVWNFEQKTQLWYDSRGELQAFAFLWKRRTDSTNFGMERIIHPDSPPALQHDILNWSHKRVAQKAIQTQKTFSMGITALEKDLHQDTLLILEHGFQLIPESFNIYLTTSLATDFPPPELPVGYQIRPLAFDEIAHYQSVFGFATVNSKHLQELVRATEYQIFVVADMNDNLVAYCECSWSRAEWLHSGQKVAWIDYVEALPDFHGKGLSTALLMHAFQTLKAQGAEQIRVVTMNKNALALQLYENAGLKRVEDEYVYLLEKYPTR